MEDASCSGSTPFKRLVDHQSRDLSHHQDRHVSRGAFGQNVRILSHIRRFCATRLKLASQYSVLTFSIIQVTGFPLLTAASHPGPAK